MTYDTMNRIVSEAWDHRNDEGGFEILSGLSIFNRNTILNCWLDITEEDLADYDIEPDDEAYYIVTNEYYNITDIREIYSIKGLEEIVAAKLDMDH